MGDAMIRCPEVIRSGAGRVCLGAILVCGSWLVGCGKVEEMAKTATETAKEAVASQTTKPAAAPEKAAPATASPAPVAPKIDSEKVLREFLALASNDIRDEQLQQLASMDASHREQVVRLDLAASPIGAAGIHTLKSFPNLS